MCSKRAGFGLAIFFASLAASYAGWLNPNQPGFIIQTFTSYESITGNNTGLIVTNGNSYQFAGDNTGYVYVGGVGSQFRGNNDGNVRVDGPGAAVLGSIASLATLTNSGAGSLVLVDLTVGQVAKVTAVGSASLLLGAGTVSNGQCIVVGDGNVSHGAKSVTAGSFWGTLGGFFGNGAGLTNLPTDGVLSGRVTVVEAGVASCLKTNDSRYLATLTNATAFVTTNHTGDVTINGALSAYGVASVDAMPGGFANGVAWSKMGGGTASYSANTAVLYQAWVRATNEWVAGAYEVTCMATNWSTNPVARTRIGWMGGNWVNLTQAVFSATLTAGNLDNFFVDAAGANTTTIWGLTVRSPGVPAVPVVVAGAVYTATVAKAGAAYPGSNPSNYTTLAAVKAVGYLTNAFSGSGVRYRLVPDAGSDTDRGAALLAAYAGVTAAVETNAMTLFLPPGVYDLGTNALVLSKEYVNVRGLIPAAISSAGKAGMQVLAQAVVRGNGRGVIEQTANNVQFSDLMVNNYKGEEDEPLMSEHGSLDDPASYWPNSGVLGTVIERVSFAGAYVCFWSMRIGITYRQTFTDCLSYSRSFGWGGEAAGTFTRCLAYQNSFGTRGNASGKFFQCTVVSDDAETSGFGAEGTASGLFVECEGTDWEFGGAYGTFSGVAIRCKTGGYGFGSYGTITSAARIYSCRGTEETFCGGTIEPGAIIQDSYLDDVLWGGIAVVSPGTLTVDGNGVVVANDARYLAAFTNVLLNGMNYSGASGTVSLPTISGPQGPAGTNGTVGAQGPAGTNGATGATGPQGPPGTNGATGATGLQGPAGTNIVGGSTNAYQSYFIKALGSGPATAGATQTVDLANGAYQTYTLTNTPLTFLLATNNLTATNAVPFWLQVTHAANSVSYTARLSTATFLLPGGVQPVFSQNTNNVDVLDFVWNGSKAVLMNHRRDVR